MKKGIAEQRVGEFFMEFKTADEIRGFNMISKRDAGLIRVYQGDKLTDEAWVVVSKAGIVRLERIQ